MLLRSCDTGLGPCCAPCIDEKSIESKCAVRSGLGDIDIYIYIYIRTKCMWLVVVESKQYCQQALWRYHALGEAFLLKQLVLGASARTRTTQSGSNLQRAIAFGMSCIASTSGFASNFCYNSGFCVADFKLHADVNIWAVFGSFRSSDRAGDAKSQLKNHQTYPVLLPASPKTFMVLHTRRGPDNAFQGRNCSA